MKLSIMLRFPSETMSVFRGLVPSVDKICILITAERDFDHRGIAAFSME